jgi:large subunit ribosomal protein L13e
MPKHNNIIPNVHFHKNWQERVKTWFNQPAKKLRRRLARKAKAARIFPRPVQGLLRPIVHPPTKKYGMKVRLGRGFTLEELKEAGINRHEALSIGISIDYRRSNKSDKTFRTNVQRLKEYKSKLVLFPKGLAHIKTGETPRSEITKQEQQKGILMPVKKEEFQFETMNIKDINTKTSVYNVLRQARAEARLVGLREKKAKEKAEKEALASKKAEKGQ